jgi:hypothetical protein
MPRQNSSASFPNGIRATDLVARFWGTERCPRVNRVPRSAGDVYTALWESDTAHMFHTARSLARILGQSPLGTTLNNATIFYPEGNTLGLTSTTPIRHYFNGDGGFAMLYSAEGGDEEICAGLCLAGKKALWIGINKLLVAVRDIAGGNDDLYEQQSNRIDDLEAQLKRAKDGADTLRKEIRDLDKLLADNNIERPTECLNCGKKKEECEDFGGKYIQPRMGSFGISKYANDFYLTSIGTWEKCEHPEKSNGGQYKETEGGMITYFGNAWNTCHKQEGDEGLCMECSMATLGMLTPKYDHRIEGAIKRVGGFQYCVPVCCFHQGCADDCGIMWKKTTQLICPQIKNIPVMNASPMDVRLGRPLPPISPSMVKITGQLASQGVKVGGRGLDGSGNLYPNQIARWEGEITDTTMRDLINRHIARGRTHALQNPVAVDDTIIAQELEAELLEDDTRPADPIVFATLID